MTTPTDKDLRALAEAATPGNLDTVNDPPDEYGGRSESDYYECPACQGDGEIDGVTYTNFDDCAMGVQFFGIGNEHAVYEAFFRAANPQTVIGLLDRIAKLEAERDNWGKLTEEFKKMSAESIGHSTNFMNEIKALRSQLEEAKAALKPFQKLANSEHYSTLALGEGIDHWPVEYTKGLTLGDLRRAAKAGGTDA